MNNQMTSNKWKKRHYNQNTNLEKTYITEIRSTRHKKDTDRNHATTKETHRFIKII